MDTRMVDLAVDVPLLMSHPKTALLAVLQLMQGWETVRRLMLMGVPLHIPSKARAGASADVQGQPTAGVSFVTAIAVLAAASR